MRFNRMTDWRNPKAMSDFQIDSGESDSPGKSGGNQSPTVLILFSVPFLLFGIIALAAAIHDPKQKKCFRCLAVGGIFLCVGIGIVIAGFYLRKNSESKLRICSCETLINRGYGAQIGRKGK